MNPRITYGIAAAAFIGVIAAAGYWIINNEFASGFFGSAAAPSYAIDGKVTHRDTDEGPWYVVFGELTAPRSLELAFDDKSICGWQERSGRCKPSVFIEGRGAHIEGTRTGEVLYVQRLTFTEPPQKTQ